MAKKRDHQDVTPRENPYGQLPDDEEYDTEYDADEPDYDEYNDGYDDEPAPSRARVKKSGSSGGFFGSAIGRVLIIVIALLLVLIVVLVAVRLIGGGKKPEDTKLPAQQGVSLPGEQPTEAPISIVFGPVSTQQPTDEPQGMAEATPTAEPMPTDTPEPTATPLPIILTNTPTPSPTARPTNTPTPSPTPSPTPKPSATPRADLGTGKTNRDANLRESAVANGKVKKTVKKGLTVTIHEAVLDTKGNVWYNVTVDDLAMDGWMRDYVITTDQKLAKPTATPKADVSASGKAEATPTPSLEEGVIGTGKTKKDANLRQIMNGKVIATLTKGKRVLIYGVSVDKKGNIWYEVRAENGKKRGFMRDYVVTLDEGVTLEMPEGVKQATPTPKTTPAAKATQTPKATAESTEMMTPKPATIGTAKSDVSATPKPATLGTSAGKAEDETDETEIPSVKEDSASDSLMDREVIGRAVTNREANVRVKPAAGGKLVRQLSKGVELMILAKYEDDKGAIWYEVTTESGKTHGFVRDYVLNVGKIDRDAETMTYPDEG